ncbi:TRAP transporter substrate-binding protein [Pseudooceanicola nitratireducens]|jgi:TRAP-type C4-dicarboxylate transport system substrate-binding protein|uniref:TRAP-type C4-dicarboxylate transport system, substrate-binding protein n=1 Tax=Pseudooceanicola nitratireducens TaxID=517719 RepID=A0A1I1IE54_9RHOB|nr:TRAP transporter substrate-binding protein [Pseudooceanicola nitratireducens]MBY6164649.1 TRAP transporter substrate-binding protein [Pseudooceanicola nitratireducens]SEJ22124.1 TRAP-type C4-dicarboxylate transport system, substrate-binding protein [Pseudooceanicola nitratireducens]SFC34251.1 TRAP-type C4-dicarboxylate transport system, substrate-binding protein [Pseudooceanicola nitratireducens]
MSFMQTALRGIAAAALIAGTGTVAMAQEVTLKLHQFLPAQASVPKQILDVWADKVEADSDGRIKIDRYPSMQLGGRPPELVDQVIDGVADIIWTVTGYTPGRFPSSEAFEMPFVMTNGEDTSRAYWQYVEKNMLDTEFADLKMLGVWVHGPGLIHSKDPITSVADLNGVKLRAPTRVTNKMFTDMGATTVGMPVPAVPEALSKGVIDATVIPWEVTTALKVSELVGNHTTWPNNALYTTTFIWAMNKDKYAALPDDLKKVIDDNSGEEFSAFAGKTMQAADQQGFDFAKERGNNIIDLNEDQIAEWKAAAAPIEAWWVEEVTKAGLDGQALLDEAKALIQENTK